MSSETNAQETIKPTSLPGVFLIERPTFPDERGSFQEIVRLPDLEALVGEQIIVRQINKSISKPGVLRGIHIAPWGKLIHCYAGKVFQVVVDCREDSETFGKAFTCELGGEKSQTIWLPPNCGNGFCVLGDQTVVYSYSVTEVFQPGKEKGLLWNDPQVSPQINWPVKSPELSDKDKVNPTLKELFPGVDVSKFPWLT